MASIKGGEQLDKYLSELSKKMANPGTLRVGFLENQTYPDGTSVATVAAIQNFGAPARGVPPRPFFSNMVASKSASWGNDLRSVLRRNGMNGKAALETMGVVIAGQLKDSIQETNSPPLASKTIARKGFDKPLVDTGVMLQSPSSEVVT
jgi:hypothetical protein